MSDPRAAASTCVTKPKLADAGRVPRTLGEVARAFFRYGSPRLLAAQLACAVLARPFLQAPGAVDAVVLVAVATYWPVQEWALHRWVLHAPPLRIAGRAHEIGPARGHRRHHEHPLDPQSTVLPAWMIALMIPLHAAFWFAIAPSGAVACTGIACLGAAALSYEWIHFFTHTAYRPRTHWFREVKRRHLAHHFHDSARWFAFAVPAVDDWLGTGARAAGLRRRAGLAHARTRARRS